MLRATTILLAGLLLWGARALAAQAGTATPSPTLPSDTLEANYAPRGAQGPMPERAPTLPSDTLDAAGSADSFPADSFPADSFDDREAVPQTPGDSAALRELRSWIQRHPEPESPPPVRAVLVRV